MTEETQTAEKRNQRKTRIGKVVSAKMEKSVVVAIERKIAHPLYKKYYRVTKRLMAHDEKKQAGLGDLVRLMETRPLSSKKRWRVVEILEKAK